MPVNQLLAWLVGLHPTSNLCVHRPDVKTITVNLSPTLAYRQYYYERDRGREMPWIFWESLYCKTWWRVPFQSACFHLKKFILSCSDARPSHLTPWWLFTLVVNRWWTCRNAKVSSFILASRTICHSIYGNLNSSITILCVKATRQ